MASLVETWAETKAETGYKIAKQFGSRFGPKVNFHSFRGVKIEDARFKKQTTQNFQQRGDYFFTLLISSNPVEVRAEAQNSLAEEATNLGDLAQAENILLARVYGCSDDPISSLLGNERYLQEAIRSNRFAWIEDYRTGFGRELKHIQDAREWLGRVDLIHWDERYVDLVSTLNHFQGRAHFGLASQGIDKKNNLELATEYFSVDLLRYEQLRRENRARPAGEGHNHRYLALSQMKQKNWDRAETEVRAVNGLFDEASKGVETSEIAHGHFLAGTMALHDRRLPKPNLDLAEYSFSEAARIWKDVVLYPFGEANAYLGLGKTHETMLHPIQAAKYSVKAFKTHPYAVFRATFANLTAG